VSKKTKVKAKATTKAKAKSKSKAKAPQAKSRRKVVAWTKGDIAELRKHSRAKTPVTAISKAMKRTVGALRQKALTLGLPLGHRR
jgi:hypothetical protein